MEDIIGKRVLDGSGDRIPVRTFCGEGKYVGLYFSAHWCPPCKSFTPKLAEFYEGIKRGPNRNNLEIVFISSDRDQESWEDYFEEMPWLALEYRYRERKASLATRFGISGIPTLIILNSVSGDVVDKDGRGKVLKDAKGKIFPWGKPSTGSREDAALRTLFGLNHLVKEGGKVSLKTLVKSEYIGLYFSAHWCPPCRGFTPMLTDFYNSVKSGPNGDKLEIVFISWDKDQDAFKSYYAKMPWAALRYSERDVQEALNQKFEVEGVPTFIIIKAATGEVVHADGRGKVMKDPNGTTFPWVASGGQALKSIFGDNIVNHKGSQVSLREISKKPYIGIYFSAHWCPPCRGFTPILAEFYEEMKTKMPGKLEIIFVSLDKDKASFEKYFRSMPWPAVDYDEEDAREELADTNGVKGVPMLLLMNNRGKVLIKNAVSKVKSEPDKFPWK